MPERRVVLVAPDLLHPPGGAVPSEALAGCRELSRFLARATPVPAGASRGGVGTLLGARFGLRTQADGDLPLAPITLAGCGGEPGDAVWMRLDPVHLHATLTDAVVLDGEGLGLDDEDARELAGVVAPGIERAGWALQVGTPTAWHVRLPHAPGVRLRALADVIGTHQRDCVFGGDDASSLRALLTEAQMALHASSWNRRREREGLRTVNALWPWGLGTLADLAPGNTISVWGGGALGAGFARLAGIESHRPVPDDLDAVIVSIRPGDTLVVADAPGRARRAGDAPGWVDALEGFSRRWLGLGVAALARGALDRLVLEPGDGRLYDLGRWTRRRWWRRPVNLAAWFADDGRDPG